MDSLFIFAAVPLIKFGGSDDQQGSIPLTSSMVGVTPPRRKPETKKALLDKDRDIDKPCFRPQIADFPPLAVIPIEHSSVIVNFSLSLSFFMRVQ